MKKTLIDIGAYVISAVLMAIPVLWISSFLCEWDGFIKTLLTIAIIFEYIGIGGAILVYVDDER